MKYLILFLCLLGLSLHAQPFTVSDPAFNHGAVSNAVNGGGGSPTPIAEWKLNGDATDATGNGHAGTLTGSPTATYTTGQDGTSNHALQFNGTSDQFVTFSGISVGSTFTVSLWLNHTSFAISDPSLIINSSGLNGLYYRSTGNIAFFDGSFEQVSCTIPASAWIHIGFVCNAGTGTFYTNGVAVPGTVTISGSFSFNEFGSANFDNLNAAMDDVRLYSTALTSPQIAAIYAAGAQ